MTTEKHTDPDWLRERYIEENRTQKEIAEMVGVPLSQVKRALRNHGIRKPQLLVNQTIGSNDLAGAADPDIDPETDASFVLVRRSGKRSGKGRRYHKFSDGEPACPVRCTREWLEWDREEARDQFVACKRCYPDGDDDDSIRDH